MTVVPAAACNYLIDPLFGAILNGDDIADANFVPVSVGFAVLSIISIYLPLYHLYSVKTKLKATSPSKPVEPIEPVEPTPVELSL